MQLEIDKIRELYVNASDNPVKANFLYDLLTKDSITTQEPIFLAYLAGAEALKARNALLPFYKLSYISQALETFKKAIQLAPDDVEIRFLRFSIELNIPFFLPLTLHLEEDKKLILQNLPDSSLSKGLKHGIADFMLKTKNLLPEERNKLKMYLLP